MGRRQGAASRPAASVDLRRTSCRTRNLDHPGTLASHKRAEETMTATNELDAILSREELPDEFCRLASSSPPREKPIVASMLSGLVPASEQQDDAVCPLMLRRHLVIPAWQSGFAARPGHHA
jgi:hypothetical protein